MVKYILAFVVLALSTGGALAGTEITLSLKDHVFTPAEIKIPAGQAAKIIVHNDDATPEEFESHDLHIEKVIPGNAKGTIMLQPLEAGKYNFVGEYNEGTAKGTIVVE